MSQTTTSDGPTRALAAFVAALDYDALPQEVIVKVKAATLDTLGCMLFGSTLPWTRIVAEQMLEEGGNPHASLIGMKARVSVPQAVLVNSTGGHGFELDDAHTRASMHAGSIAIATALALSEWRGGSVSGSVSGRDFIVATVAGYEAGLRVGIAGAGNIFKRGFHSASVCGGFVAAATAARLLDLDAERTQHAFGIVGSMASGLAAAQEGAMVKRLHAGQAARNGVTAALLARRGFTGITNVLEAPFGGFLSAIADHGDVGALTAGLGSEWETLGLGFKPYATAGSIHPALALLDAIMREHGLAANDLERIDVACTTHCRDHVAWPYSPQGVASAQMNMYYALSAMALDRAAMIEQFKEERLEDPRILEFMRRISVTPDAGFDALGNAYRYATRVAVTTRQGAKHEQQTLYRPGSPESPLVGDTLTAKFDLLARRVLSAEACERLKANVQSLDSLADLEPLLAHLRV